MRDLIIAGAVAAAVVAGSSLAYVQWRDVQREIGEQTANDRWTEAVRTQKIEFDKELEKAQAKVNEAQIEAKVIIDTQKIKDVENDKVIAGYGLKLRNANRLRDPKASNITCTYPPADPNSARGPGPGDQHATSSGGLLSEELSGLLRTLTLEADQINIAYASSRKDAESLRVLLTACGAP